MPPFTNIESYKHKCAKEIFKQWCDNSGGQFKTNWIEKNRKGEDVEKEIYWSSNRSQEAWLEYPVVVNNDINSIQNNWDEIWPGFTTKKMGDYDVIDDYRHWNNFVPSYDDCKEYNLQPIAVIDVVLPHKGQPSYLVEICHTNPVSDEKLKKLKILEQFNDNFNLIEIDAEWILRQTKIPSKLQIKRWLI